MFTISKFIYLKKNIQALNNSNYILDADGQSIFESVQNFKDYADLLFSRNLQRKTHFKRDLITELSNKDYIKKGILDIANGNFIRKSTLEKFYSLEVLSSITGLCNAENYTDHSLKYFQETLDKKVFSFIKSDLKKTLYKQYDFISTKGFSENKMNINKGIMTANAGDSAQLLFVSRAILIGFNCSNVDVRSSRYDSIIDFNGKLLRIQIKGLSSSSISFKDRDRGGQGIDHTHARNIGKRISSKDCDIYVAVDRQFGTCYIIPVKKYIDPIADAIIGKPINISSLDIYKENWTIIEEVAKHY